MIGYEYKGKSRIIWRGQVVDPSDILNLPKDYIKNAQRLGIIREIKIKEDAKNSKAKKARGTNGGSGTKKRSQGDGKGD